MPTNGIRGYYNSPTQGGGPFSYELGSWLVLFTEPIEPRLKQCIPITEVHCEIVRVS
jgi:hypothetical protein